MELFEELKQFRLEIEQKKGKRDSKQETYDKQDIEISDLDIELKDSEEAQIITQIVAKETQKNLKYNIENIVTRGLETVFEEEPYSFSADFEIKRNKTECVLSFISKGDKIDPMNSSGYGAVDIGAFTLRISLWSLKKNNDPIFIMDEPFRNLDLKKQSLAGKMLKELSDKLGIQFIISTHKIPLTEFGDNIIDIVKKDGISEVRRIS